MQGGAGLEPFLRGPERPDGRGLRQSRSRSALHQCGEFRARPAHRRAPRAARAQSDTRASSPPSITASASAISRSVTASRDRSASCSTRHSAQGLLVNRITGQAQFTISTAQDRHGFSRAPRLYADAFWRPSDRFEAQAGVQRTSIEHRTDVIRRRRSRRASASACRPFEGHWLRAAYRRDGDLPVAFTLAPVTTVGLVPNALPSSLGGHTNTLALRWDAEWSPHVFTAVEYQRQDLQNLSLPIANTFDGIWRSAKRGSSGSPPPPISGWRYGIGVFGTIGTTNSGDPLRRSAPARCALHRRSICPRRRHVRSPEPDQADGRRHLRGRAHRRPDRQRARGLLDDGCGHHVGNARSPPVWWA